MARYRVSIQFDTTRIKRTLKKARSEAFTKRIAEKVGRQTVKAMKQLIKTGQHTIRGKGNRFKAYKGSYAKGIKAGVYDEFGKRLRPVNLTLTGEFLENLVFETKLSARTGYFAKVGFFDDDSKLKERGHRDGENNQEKRPIIPQTKERFRVKIEEVQQKEYVDALRQYLRRNLK